MASQPSSALADLSESLDPLNSPATVSRVTGVSVNTLAYWRCTGKGIPFVKMGRIVRYKRDDVLAYIQDHTFTSSSAARTSKEETA
ncbi:helix-turn-helix domain-containing protein [Bifidobacterium callimiconis]|uniref:helix-turn-helix domain-containing protein n=1 Tax=Bifidobacterium callimiconis TaxID=2306973 RepID=UPI001BDC9923|nr:helix-turn-helix domain-containing protein [Bifidobacterium callimiconis]MBT1177597.1 helix-turn-helix domain-containing protein [Bifidobacterium callimiconis]